MALEEAGTALSSAGEFATVKRNNDVTASGISQHQAESRIIALHNAYAWQRGVKNDPGSSSTVGNHADKIHPAEGRRRRDDQAA